MRLKV